MGAHQGLAMGVGRGQIDCLAMIRPSIHDERENDMLGIKKFILGLIIGLLAGLWAGVNIGQDRPVWSNPFAEPSLAQKARGAASEMLHDAKKAAREGLQD